VSPEAFRAFTRRLQGRVEADPRVWSFVTLGSAADTIRSPDRHSDHDVWLVVAPGEQENLRCDLSWLPEPDRIVLSYRETEHGLKAVYDDGHLVELAVFAPGELNLVRLDAYRIHFDRSPGQEVTRVVAERRALREPPPSQEWLVGQALCHLLVGLMRHRRGERLSGRHYVHHLAIERILTLLAVRTPAEGPDDPLDPWRRVEERNPQWATRIEAALVLPVPQGARALFEIVRDLGVDAPFRPEGWEAVRRALDAE
jgi:hypothetical protein